MVRDSQTRGHRLKVRGQPVKKGADRKCLLPENGDSVKFSTTKMC